MSSASKTALRVALLYVGLVALWALFANELPSNGITERFRTPPYEAWSDWGFAVVTGVLLFAVLRGELLARAEASHRRTEDALRRAQGDLELRVQTRTADLEHTNRLLRKEIADRDRMQRDLATLLNFSYEVAATLRLEPLVDLVLDRLADLVGYTGAAIYECQEGESVLITSRGSFSAEAGPERASTKWQELLPSADMGVPGVSVITADDATGGSAMVLPLVLQGHLIGVIRLSHSLPDYFDERQAKLAFIIANQAAVAIENARLYEEAQRKGVLRERARLARELHDSIIQEVHGLVWKIRAARDLSERGSDSVATLLERAAVQAKASLADLRTLVFELHPDVLEEQGLTGVLQQCADTVQAAYPAAVRLELDGEPEVELPVKEALYRIAREAMYNAAKHAEAGEIVLRLHNLPDQLWMEVTDNGAGFDVSAAHPGHFGLANMRERAQQVNATAEIYSEPQCGTRVVVRVPLPMPANGNGHDR